MSILASMDKMDINELKDLQDKYLDWRPYVVFKLGEKYMQRGQNGTAKDKFRDFLKPYLGITPGAMVSPDGTVLGTHQGIAYYTIGQRKGLKIGGQGDAWFVVGKDVENNRLLIAQGADHPALYADDLIAKEIHWISGNPPLFPFRCTAKIRYRQADQPCVVTQGEGDTVHVLFDHPQRAITPQITNNTAPEPSIPIPTYFKTFNVFISIFF